MCLRFSTANVADSKYGKYFSDNLECQKRLEDFEGQYRACMATLSRSHDARRCGSHMLITALAHQIPPGLHQYKPVDSRETQILGRFPMRNRFISEYIYHKTGKYRSSKQIGSRLQQFRDTSEGRECEYPSRTSCLCVH